jgi:hypothetical protein
LGIYKLTLTLSGPPADVDVIPVAQLKVSPGFVGAVVGAGDIVVETQSAAAGFPPVDADFFIHVVDGT